MPVTAKLSASKKRQAKLFAGSANVPSFAAAKSLSGNRKQQQTDRPRWRNKNMLFTGWDIGGQELNHTNTIRLA